MLKNASVILLLGCISCSGETVEIPCANSQLIQTIPSDTLRFFALGDWGRDGKYNQKTVADAMEKLASVKPIRFVLSLGDNFYPNGVSSTDDSQWQTSFEKIYDGPNLTSVPWYVALGNHDYLSDPTAEIEYGTVCGRWTMPDYFYTVKIPLVSGSVRLVVLDTNPFEKSYYSDSGFDGKFVRDTVRQKRWMDSVFSLNDADWTIVSGHHPLYTGGLRVSEPNSVRASLLPIFQQYKLPVYFAGHEHDLQHLKSPDYTINQFISGAGSSLRETGTMKFTKFAASVNGFMSVELTRNVMDVYVINCKLDTLYQVRLVR